MSFGSPFWLVALTLIPLALLAQRLSRARARRYAARFTAVGTLQQALAMGASWRRHVPVAALLAATALLVIGLARPHITHRVPINDAALMLVLDHSGSMAATDVQPTRLSAAINAANTFVNQVPPSIRVGAVAFSTVPDAVQQPVTDHAAARNVIDTQNADGGTATGPALQLALQLLHGDQSHHPPSAIVLLSDGAANDGVDPVAVATQAKQEHIPIYTVALGTAAGVLPNGGPFGQPVPVPPDPQLMGQIASASGGHSFDARTADDLSSIYKSLGRQLSTVPRRTDITIYLLIAAAVLLTGAAAASLRTSTVLA